MRPYQQVLVARDGDSIPGLLLKWRKTGGHALVTYEIEGRVSTEWIPAEQVLPLAEPPRPTAAMAD